MRSGTSGVLSALGRLQAALLRNLEPQAILRNFLEAATEEGVERAALFLFHPQSRELVGEVASSRGRHYTVSAIALPIYPQGPIQGAFFAEGLLKRGVASAHSPRGVLLVYSRSPAHRAPPGQPGNPGPDLPLLKALCRFGGAFPRGGAPGPDTRFAPHCPAHRFGP